MVAMAMGSRRRSLRWCVVVLVAGLLLAAAEADDCIKYCQGKVNFWRCVDRCGSRLEVAQQQLSSFCGDYCRVEEPNVDYRYCVRRCEFGPRRRSHSHLHLPAGGADGSSGGAVDVQAAAAAVRHEAAAGARPMSTEDCEAYCRRKARDFPPKFAACVRQCQAGGHPGGDGGRHGILHRDKQEGPKVDGEVHLSLGTGNIAVE